MSAVSNRKASQRRWAAVVLALIGCHGADVEPEIMDAGIDAPPVAIVCTPDGPSSALLLHTFDEGPTQELLLAGSDLVFLDGTVFRRFADEWARGRDLRAIQVQGDLFLIRDSDMFRVFRRHPDESFEEIARHELDESPSYRYRYVVAARLDGDRLAMSGYTPLRINVRERWQDPLAEPVVHETDAFGRLALEGDWLANGGGGVIEVRRRSTDGRWWSTQQTIPTRGRDFVLNHGRLVAGGIDLDGRSAVFVHRLDVHERWQRVQVLHANAFDPREPATEGDGFGTVVRVAIASDLAADLTC